MKVHSTFSLSVILGGDFRIEEKVFQTPRLGNFSHEILILTSGLKGLINTGFLKMLAVIAEIK